MPTPTPAAVVTPAKAAVVVPSSSTTSPLPIVTSSVPAPVPTTSAVPTPIVPTTSAEVAPSSKVTSSAAAASSSSAPVVSGSGYGITYNPYNGDGTCKTASQVSQDFDGFGGGYSFVRTYGTDCNTVPNVLAAAKSHGLLLFQGVFSIGNLQSELALIISGAAGDWSQFKTISIGNELVNNGAQASYVVDAINTARSTLRAAGYNGPVVTSDTLVATIANPSLCDASDYCTVNCHPFFDGNIAASGAGSFITSQIVRLKAVLANSAQTVVISETGWPSQGLTNGAAIPSPSEQATAISSIRSAFSGNPGGVTLFNPYNMMWKTNTAAQFEAEQYWGFLGTCPSG